METYLGVRYADLVPLLLEAVKELDQRTHAVHAGADGAEGLAEDGYEDEDEYAEEDGYADDDVVWGKANTTTATPATATAASAVPGPAACDRDRLMTAVASLTAMLDRAGMSLSSRSLCDDHANTQPDPWHRSPSPPLLCTEAEQRRLLALSPSSKLM